MLKFSLKDNLHSNVLFLSGSEKLVQNKLVQAWMECLWDPKDPGNWTRLDDGSTDIDSNDAWEYSFERFIPVLIKVIEGDGT